MRKLLLLLIPLFLALCVQHEAESPKVKTVTDMAGRTLNVSSVERIVSLNSEALEITYLLGEGKKVVGAGTWSRQDVLLPKLYNFSEIEDVGTASRPNVERIIALKPDIVFTYYCGRGHGYETPKEIVEKLESAGIPVFGICIAVIRQAEWAQYYEMIEMIGNVLGKEREAKDLSGYLRKLKDEFEANASKVEKKRVVYTWSEPNRIAGNSTITHVTIELAGGLNIGGELAEPYATVSPEFIVEKNPEIWLIWHLAKYNASDIIKDPRFRDVDAVKNGRVYKEPDFGSNWNPVRAHLYLLWHGKIFHGIPDFDLKAEEICRKFYGVSCFGR